MTEPLTGLALIARADAYRAEVLRRKRIGLRPASFGEWLEREGVDRLDGHSDGGEQGQFFERHGAGHPALLRCARHRRTDEWRTEIADNGSMSG